MEGREIKVISYFSSREITKKQINTTLQKNEPILYWFCRQADCTLRIASLFSGQDRVDAYNFVFSNGIVGIVRH